ncbi:ATP-dependent DNA helicase RecG [Phaeodactylibacter luteus]|uniref:ATP-dependent DNA helicase RecG n=1 Tax=Phaeodactylibacter luteus TaxID=1564516 RepID=A0A5C6RTI1_9BACT|nr:ATP-dependent DNA helicase RecG [Phaeodactylibacter luteus]TXB65563.1 ATP-dependent DNA helicase RecG [Phaeodactylibacter luteus]
MNFLESDISYLKGVGPKRAELLNKELSIFTVGDLLQQFPHRYIDKTQFHRINELREDSGEVQLKGTLRRLVTVGEGRKKRLTARFRDETGAIDLVWFSGVSWLEKQLEVGKPYVIYGRVNAFRDKLSIPHPEMEEAAAEQQKKAVAFAPVYPSTEKLNTKGLDARNRRRIMAGLFEKLNPQDLAENLPPYLVQKFRFPSRYEALRIIHFPRSEAELQLARNRLKFEELFFLQLRLLQIRRRRDAIKGYRFGTVGEYFMKFYEEKLPFELTHAQKRVLREIRRDLGRAVQMNRLLQGDVGSGKTIVGLMTMLLALDNGYQACLLAPTEILAQQHYHSISAYLEGMDVEVGFLSGSVKGKKRKALLQRLAAGEVHFLIGTHAILEDPVVFQNLGLAITDEQHRFGVAQRARLWRKASPCPPHILVMTATPIPRTLAMTLYGDLDVSVIDELPPGRKEIKTLHKNENNRMRVIGFMREEIAKGRQVYVVYPLIEESETLDLQNLQDGYEALQREFPPPDYQISIVHGRMKPDDKDYEMQRFVSGKTQIMVATTVIEVGVNVPNASVMVIENTERFGLSQLHQLRGRVGRGAEQSYCILMSSFKLSKESKERISTMVRTNNGFEIAEADLKLRGPGNIEGTQQSGILNFKIADLARDGRILQTAREVAARILDDDPQLERPEHHPAKWHLEKHGRKLKGWSRIS